MSRGSATMPLDTRLAAFAEIALRVGVDLQPGQELVLTAPLEASPLVQRMTEHAYRHGSGPVTCLYEDPQMIRAHLAEADEGTLDRSPAWLSEGISRALDGGAAHLSILGPYPDLLARVPMDRILRAHAAQRESSEAVARRLGEVGINATQLPFPTLSWAKSVFPDLAAEDAQRGLWEAILAAARATTPEPTRSLVEHVRTLEARCASLEARNLSALRFHGGHTDLTVGLVDGHHWAGGSVVAKNGAVYLPRVPAEEVFTCVHRERADGRLALSKPLVLAGSRIEDACIEFRAGAPVRGRAAKGRETLERLLSV